MRGNIEFRERFPAEDCEKGTDSDFGVSYKQYFEAGPCIT
jgi:hypothetical protein